MSIQLTNLGLSLSGTVEDLRHRRQEFDRQHCILLPGLFEPTLLQEVQQRLNRAEFYERSDEGIALESCLRDKGISSLLHFLLNNRNFFQVVEQLTGCGRIGCFEGRVYHLNPACGHYDSWHDDMVGHRKMLAVSINLSQAVYRGGVLQIRDQASKQIVHEMANTGLGDGIIFRIASYLEHRVTAVEGSVVRTAFAGWFYSQPDYETLLQASLGVGVPV
jgi:hypothetical protein